MSKVYAIQITAKGIVYNFHTSRVDSLQEMFEDSHLYEAFDVYEETHEMNTATTTRLMSRNEVIELIHGKGSVLVEAL